MVDSISTVADPGVGPEAAWVLQKKAEGAALRWHVVDGGGARSLCGLDIRIRPCSTSSRAFKR